MTEYVVVWSGAHLGQNADLLCVQMPRREHHVVPETCHERTQRIRERLIGLMREREIWTIRELRDRLGADRFVVDGIIQRAKAVGVIRSVGYGVVTLARRDEAAA